MQSQSTAVAAKTILAHEKDARITATRRTSAINGSCKALYKEAFAVAILQQWQLLFAKPFDRSPNPSSNAPDSLHIFVKHFQGKGFNYLEKRFPHKRLPRTMQKVGINLSYGSSHISHQRATTVSRTFAPNFSCSVRSHSCLVLLCA